jgi:hypothetical protein
MTCWKVERFVQRIVLEISFGRKWMRSSVASERHFVGSEPCLAASPCAAVVSALPKAARATSRRG